MQGFPLSFFEFAISNHPGFFAPFSFLLVLLCPLFPAEFFFSYSSHEFALHCFARATQHPPSCPSPCLLRNFFLPSFSFSFFLQLSATAPLFVLPPSFFFFFLSIRNISLRVLFFCLLIDYSPRTRQFPRRYNPICDSKSGPIRLKPPFFPDSFRPLLTF